MKIEQAQQIVRKASPGWLACNLYLGKQEALPALSPPKQKELTGPSINLSDRDGAPIKRGDIVRFWVTYDADEHATYSLEESPDSSEFTEMLDVVIELNGTLYFYDRDVGGAAFAWRHARFSKIVGHDEAQAERAEASLAPLSQKSLPSTVAELAAALRNPLPPSKANGRCYSPLEAMKEWKPLTKEMICDLMAKEATAREKLMTEYAERTGQQVDYCEECNLGIREEEVEEEWGTRAEAMPCGECDGLGVVIL